MPFHVKFAVNYTLELFTAGVLALGSFAFLFWLLNNIFPIGPGLATLMSANENILSNTAANDRALWVANANENANLSTNNYGVATLSSVFNNVKSKQANQLVWKNAKKGISLFGGDSIQTFDGSKATIKFNENSQLELGENSLVVINRLEEDIIWKEKKSYLVMVEGTMRGKVSPQQQKPVYVEISMPNSITSVRSNAQSNLVDFQIKINSNRSSVVSVYEGTASVETKTGEIVSIEKNQASIVQDAGIVSAPEIIPETPLLNTPPNDEIYYFKDIPPTITFKWLESKYSDKYRFVLAKDKQFSQIVFDKIVKNNNHTYRNLKHGTYYWQVSGLTNNRSESFASNHRSISVIQDSMPPKLTIKFPEPSSNSSEYFLTGETEKTARVYINSEEITVENGRFTHLMKLKRGPNIIVVEAVDMLGNVSYRSETIHGQF